MPATEMIEAERLAEWSRLAVDSLADQDLIGGIDAVLQAVKVLDGLSSRMLVEADKRGLARALGSPSTAAWLSGSGHVDAGG